MGSEMCIRDSFSIVTNKSLDLSNLNITVNLIDNTVVYRLKVDYLVMVSDSLEYTLINSGKTSLNIELETSNINSGLGYRSEYQVVIKNTTSVPIFQSTTLKSILIL